MDIEIAAEFSASTDKVTSRLDKILEQGRRRWLPRTIQAQVTQALAGTYLMDFGQPARGTLWNPVGVTLTGGSPSFALTGLTRAVFFIGDPNNFTVGQAVANLEGTTTNSFTQLFPREAFWVYPTEDPFFQVVTSAAATVWGTLRVHEYSQDAIEPRYA